MSHVGLAAPTNLFNEARKIVFGDEKAAYPCFLARHTELGAMLKKDHAWVFEGIDTIQPLAH
jgi:hypothetical protein